MYKTTAEATAFAAELLALLKERGGGQCEIVVCPPFTALAVLRDALAGSPVELGGQNLYPQKEGAYTGEISGSMLREAGASYAIIGHSERRQYFGESDAFLNEKVKAALSEGLKPILCVGETLAQRRGGEMASVCQGQLAGALAGLDPSICDTLVIAYEPVWAIGTGESAQAADAQETAGLLRQWLREAYGATAADQVRIQYGGSAKPENIAGYLAMPDIDGALIGGAGLKAASYWAMIQAAG
jgi:triosephosphate isomerase